MKIVKRREIDKDKNVRISRQENIVTIVAEDWRSSEHNDPRPRVGFPQYPSHITFPASRPSSCAPEKETPRDQDFRRCSKRHTIVRKVSSLGPVSFLPSYGSQERQINTSLSQHLKQLPVF